MKKRILFAFLALGAGELRAQLVTVTETSAKTPITLDFKKHQIVDINSKLSVELSHDQLTSAISAANQGNPALTQKLNSLISLLSTEQQILASIKPAAPNVAGDPKGLHAYSALMLDFIAKLKQDPGLRAQVDSLYAVAVAMDRAGTLDKRIYPTQTTYIIKNLRTLTDNLAASIASSKGLSTITVQVAAFINTKAASNVKVHVENFDNYSVGQYYDVPRWVTTFSQDDINAFNQAGQLSNTLNQAVAGNFSQLLKLIPDTLSSDTCFTSLVALAKQDAAALAGQAASQKSAFITAAQQQINSVYAAIQLFEQQKTSAAANPLQQFNQASNDIMNVAQNLPAEVTALKATVANDLLTTEADVKALAAQLDACTKKLQAEVAVITKVYNTVTGLLQPIQGTANTAAQVTGGAFGFAINQIPAKGYIDLKTTGMRENGDNLVIKVITRTPDDVVKNLPGTTLENETIELQQISFYSTSNIAVILASPLGSNSQVTLKSKFQFAPAGSLVVKFGSRTSSLWNTVSPGLGFNISTPDFNLDGSPDVSYGGVFTLFHDILSVGLSYNTKTSSSFWFFGLSLPFSTFGLPVGSVQTQKQ